jgi:hypothetical protein
MARPQDTDAGYLTTNPLATQTGDREQGLSAAWKQRSWRNIAVSLTDPDFGEQKAQSGEKACLH